jgi:glycosyltransferase involved in cell wall biosynthesis
VSVQAPAVLRLGYVIGTFPLVTTTFISREVAAIGRLGASVTLLSLRRPSADERPIASESDEPLPPIAYLLPVRRSTLVRVHLVWAIRHPLRYVGTLVWLATRPHPDNRRRFRTLLHFGEGIAATSYFERARVQHIHAHFVDRAATVALVASRMLRVSYSVTAHANDIYRDPVLLPEKLTTAAFAVTVSEANRRHLLAACPDLAPSRLEVIHGWVDPQAWSRSGERPSDDRLRIVSVGRLVEKKGHRTLIEACSMLRDEGIRYACRIVGDGPLRAELEARILGLGLRDHVRLEGSASVAQTRASLDAADVFVLACTVAADGDRDGSPVAIAEAMSMELPIISTTLPGIEELVTPDVGVLVPQDDPAALASTLAEVEALGREGRTRMGRRGRGAVLRSFTVAGGAQRLADLVRQAVDGAVVASRAS